MVFDADETTYNLRRYALKKPMVASPLVQKIFEVVVGLQKQGTAIPAYQIESEINRYAPEQVSRFFLFDGNSCKEYESLLIENEQRKRIKGD